MSSGPVLILVLEKENVVADWRTLIGPTDANKAKLTHPKSIRARCGVDAEKNCVHGSDSIQSSIREIKFFFTRPSGQFLSSNEQLGRKSQFYAYAVIGVLLFQKQFLLRSSLNASQLSEIWLKWNISSRFMQQFLLQRTCALCKLG
ncbi:putative nucleoside diphosphate kinase 5 [Drosera capensis]